MYKLKWTCAKQNTSDHITERLCSELWTISSFYCINKRRRKKKKKTTDTGFVPCLIVRTTCDLSHTIVMWNIDNCVCMCKNGVCSGVGSTPTPRGIDMWIPTGWMDGWIGDSMMQELVPCQLKGASIMISQGVPALLGGGNYSNGAGGIPETT